MRSKFGNSRTGGYDSRREARRANDLRLLERAGVISHLEEQVRFEVIPKCGKERAAHYIADFRYMQDGQTVVEDCKGFRTPEYRLKRKLMQVVHGITIKET